MKTNLTLTPEMQAKIEELKNKYNFSELSPAELDGVAGGIETWINWDDPGNAHSKELILDLASELKALGLSLEETVETVIILYHYSEEDAHNVWRLVRNCWDTL